jgi:hypothetical protein
MRSPPAWTRRGKLSASGASASSANACRGWRNDRAPGAQRSFPPSLVVAVKALACELPYRSEVPLSRWSLPEIRREVIERGLVASIGESTLWRWLTDDAIRPWAHRSWIFPRDPDFERKASRVLDLYEGRWQGTALSSQDCVVCADEKTSIQARRRCQPTLATAPARPMRVEHEYDRLGAWSYLAAWDVRRARVYGRCERGSSIAAFDRLVAQVMTRRPYRHAPRVFWTMDNGSVHRGAHCIARLQRRWPNLIPVHTWCMRAGSTRSRSTSPSCSARPSRRTTFAPSANFNSACSTSRLTTRGSLNLFNGDSHDGTCAASCSSSTPLTRGWPVPPDGRQIRHRTFGPEY